MNRIRRAQQELNAEALNTKNLVIHASAFGLFMFAYSVLLPASLLLAIFPDSPTVAKIYSGVYYFYLFANFLS